MKQTNFSSDSQEPSQHFTMVAASQRPASVRLEKKMTISCELPK